MVRQLRDFKRLSVILRGLTIVSAFALFFWVTATQPADAQVRPELGAAGSQADQPSALSEQQIRAITNSPSQRVESRDETANPAQQPDAPRLYLTTKTPYEFWLTGLTIAVLAVSILALVVMAWQTGLTENFTRTFTIVVVIFAALFLISAGYTDKQAAPVYSLLGTIIGYIFGRMADGTAKNGTPAADDATVGRATNGGNPQPAEAQQEGAN